MAVVVVQVGLLQTIVWQLLGDVDIVEIVEGILPETVFIVGYVDPFEVFVVIGKVS